MKIHTKIQISSTAILYFQRAYPAFVLTCLAQFETKHPSQHPRLLVSLCFMASTDPPSESASATTMAFTNVPHTYTCLCATSFAGELYPCPLLGLFGRQCTTLLLVYISDLSRMPRCNQLNTLMQRPHVGPSSGERNSRA